MGTEAEVKSMAEGQVAGPITVKIEDVRIGELRRIAIGRGIEEQRPRTTRDTVSPIRWAVVRVLPTH